MRLLNRFVGMAGIIAALAMYCLMARVILLELKAHTQVVSVQLLYMLVVFVGLAVILFLGIWGTGLVLHRFVDDDKEPTRWDGLSFPIGAIGWTAAVFAAAIFLTRCIIHGP